MTTTGTRRAAAANNTSNVNDTNPYAAPAFSSCSADCVR